MPTRENVCVIVCVCYCVCMAVHLTTRKIRMRLISWNTSLNTC